MCTRLAGVAICLIAATAVGTWSARGQGRDAAAASSEHRVALVVGNAAYAESVLNNPVNDARGMAEALRAAGFDVIERVNADNLGMRRAVAEFGERLREGGVGLFYYSGHGIQVNGRNYLIPIAAQIRSERTSVQRRSISTLSWASWTRLATASTS